MVVVVVAFAVVFVVLATRGLVTPDVFVVFVLFAAVPDLFRKDFALESAVFFGISATPVSGADFRSAMASCSDGFFFLGAPLLRST